MDAQTSDLMVRLAAVGCSGVAIFAIFWMGVVISRLEKGTDPEKYRTIRFFMGTCVVTVMISGFAGYKNFEVKAKDVQEARKASEDLVVALAREKQIIPPTLPAASVRKLDPAAQARLKSELSRTLDAPSVDNILRVYQKR